MAACLFVRAPCVGASVGALLSAFLQVGHQLRARRSALLLSEFPGGKSAASALPPPDWVRGEETPRGRRCKSQWTYRKKKKQKTKRKTGSHTQSHVSIHPSEQTLNKSPGCDTNRLLMR